jgi:hypothetical protein
MIICSDQVSCDIVYAFKVGAGQWYIALFVPGYSGGPVSEFHGIPC